MRLLLDTHIYLWWLEDDSQLSKKARLLITNANAVYVSSVSIWEMSIKQGLGKLAVDINSLVLAIEMNSFLELPVSAQHAVVTSQLPLLHRDPFDRMLIAQAMYEPLQFLTADATLQQYSDLVELV